MAPLYGKVSAEEKATAGREKEGTQLYSLWTIGGGKERDKL